MPACGPYFDSNDLVAMVAGSLKRKVSKFVTTHETCRLLTVPDAHTPLQRSTNTTLSLSRNILLYCIVVRQAK